MSSTNVSATNASGSSDPSYTLIPILKVKEFAKNTKRLREELAEEFLALSNPTKEEIFKIFDQKIQNFSGSNHDQSAKKPKVERPPQAPSSYILFCKEQRSRIVTENPDADNKAIIRLLGEAWHQLTDAQKSVYESQHAEAQTALKKSLADGTYVRPEKTKSAPSKSASTKEAAKEPTKEAAKEPAKKPSTSVKKDAVAAAPAPVATPAPKKAPAKK